MAALLLVLVHAAALGLFTWSPFWWAQRDAAAIAQDGDADSLGPAWHGRRLAMRAAGAVVVAVAASVPAAVHGPVAALASCGGLLAAAAGLFGFFFNPSLSRRRALDPYYVSFSPTTARLDQWLAGRATRAFPDHGAPDAVTGANRAAYAGAELRRLLWAGLLAGAAAEAAGLVAGLTFL